MAAEGGWTTGICEDTNEVFFIAEASAMTDGAVVSEAWVAVKRLVIEQAVRDGIVRYVEPPSKKVDEMRAAVMAGHLAD